MQPEFWQALGKALGWETWKTDKGFSRYSEPTGHKKHFYKIEWLYHWHRFIDHIAEGKDVDTFFEELIK